MSTTTPFLINTVFKAANISLLWFKTSQDSEQSKPHQSVLTAFIDFTAMRYLDDQNN